MASTTHLHKRHRGLIPDDQLATGTPSSGRIPVSDGAGSRVWTAPSTAAGGWEAIAGATKLETGRTTLHDANEESSIYLNGSIWLDASAGGGDIWLIPDAALAVGVGGIGLLLPVQVSDPTAVQDGHIYYNETDDVVRLRANGAWVDLGAGGSGAPDDATYLVTAAHAGLSAEVVVGATPGGELGGTWASPTVDATHSGSTHAAAQAAAEATAAGALTAHTGDASDAHDASAISIADAGNDFTATDVEGALDELQADAETHAAAADPHAGYRLESADHSHATTGLQGGQVAGSDLSGTPGGELGGTWASPTVDATHAGSTHTAATDTHIADAADAHDASAISVVPVGSLTATDVQAALAELDGDIAGGGHAEDHDHDGAPTQKLAQANTHETPDTDTGSGSLHHTIGASATQAAAGDHSHGGGSLTLPTIYAVGASASGTGDVTPGLPTGHVANDIAVLIVQSDNQAAAAPAGYTRMGPVAGFGTAGAAGATRITAFWKRDNGAESNPTVVDTVDHTLAIIVGVRGCPTTGDPFLNVGAKRKTTASVTGTANAGATPVDACLVMDIFAHALDSASAVFSSPVNADLGSVTEQVDVATADGNGGGIGVVTGTKAIAGSFAATTVTMTSATNVALSFVFLPAGITARAGFVDRQVFLTPGSDTWTKPNGAKTSGFIGIGGGSSGSAGRNAATASGGGGGGGGARQDRTFGAVALPATLNVTVGTGGPATANTDGAAATAGTASSVQVGAVTTYLIYADGGYAAAASASGAGGAGGAGGGGYGNPAAAGAATNVFGAQSPPGGTGATTGAAGSTNQDFGGGGGGGGGTTQAGTTGGNGIGGGGGGGGRNHAANFSTGGASFGLLGGATVGASGTDSAYPDKGGSGGAGGNSAAGPGGASGWPGGGGGGGGSQSGAQRGGAGADGVVTIVTFM